MQLKEAYEAYNEYLQQWEAQNIDKTTLLQTASTWRCEYDKGTYQLPFREYTKEKGYVNGVTVPDFEEFYNNQYQTQLLAESIEQYMYNVGEYEVEAEKWVLYGKCLLNNFKNEREAVKFEIEHDLNGEKPESCLDLIKYFESEEYLAAKRKDEKLPEIQELLKKTREHGFGSEDAYKEYLKNQKQERKARRKQHTGVERD